MSINPHTKLGRYEIRSKIGEGGMGEVYLAEDTRLRRRVALKVLPQLVAADADRLLRFEREAFAASGLNHPNILTIFEFGVAGKMHFLASEFVEGVSLRERMSRPGMTVTETLEIVIQIASALQAAHEAGIIHRDIKPDNVMIRTDGYVKVLDFGLAKLSEPGAVATGPVSDPEAQTRMQLQTQAGMIMGTVAYMSPEQARGQEVDRRTDVWSLGCVLYEMLTRQQPFRGETTADAIANIIHREPVPLLMLRQDANAELERIINLTLAKDVDERYQTAKDLLGDLKQLQKRLEFEAELERSSAPSLKTEAQTQVIRAPTTAETTTRNSIAVLPFSNLSADSDNEYFCDGLAEELLNALAKIDHLKVAARTSAFSFKGKNANVSEIGQTLSVKTVLEGSVRRSGNRLRITVQLVNASDGYQLWTERYDREMQDIFDVQDEITLAIVDALKLKLFSEEKAALLKRYTDNTEAYQLYLQGRYCYNKYTPEYLQKGIEYFEKAIELEPEYAPAYAVLCFCYGALFYFGSAAPQEIVPRYRALTLKALEIDDRLVDAYLSRASIEFYYDWEFGKAESDYQRAIELNPNSPDAHWRYGHFLANCERFDEAIKSGRRAVELDPLSLVVQFFMARIYLLARRFDEGFGQIRKMQELEPNFAGGLTQLGGLYLATGKYDEAIEAYKKALALGHFEVAALSYLGVAYGIAGKRDDAHQILNQLFEVKQSRYVSPFSIARVYSGLGENDKAFEWFEKAFKERSGEMVALKSETLAHLMGNTIIRDDRFRDLVQRVGMQVNRPVFDKTTSEANEAQTEMLSPVTANVSEPGAVATGPTGSRALASPTKNEKAKGVGKLLIALLALVALMAAFFGYRYSSSNKQIESIAVMPFLNESGHQDVEYLSDGMTETLMSSLSRLPNLNVKARSLVFRYKGKDTDARTIGKELNVQAVLNGRIVQHSDGLTLYLELVDTDTGNRIWGDQYNRKEADLVSLQTEIALDVSQKLRTKLSGADEQKLTKKYTENAEAYQLYLKGRFFVNQRTAESLRKAIEYFDQAIAIDPNYALGYAGLADSYLLLGIPDAITGALSPQDSLPKARAAAEKALQIDNSVGEVYVSLAHVKWKEWDWAGAEADFDRGIKLNPNYPIGRLYHAVYLSSLSRQDEAMKEIRRAQELDPLSLPINASVVYVLYLGRQYDEAITAGKKTLEMDAVFALTHQRLGLAYVQKKMYKEAIGEFQQAANNSNRAPLAIISLGHGFAASGNKVEAQRVLAELKDLSRRQYVSPYGVAMIYAALGDKEQAFQSLEKAYAERNTELVFLKVDPRADPLRADLRFQELVKKVGIPS
ncbi:MAG TPA: tetratricopeptide repeat protein [Pyrinomonadaceae bacterium]|nr:tetratricopeptide repeat protein [Pyrinomonadaceae bacterium]